MRSPVQVCRDRLAEFRGVMREHEEYLLAELAPSGEALARARARRAGTAAESPVTAFPGEEEPRAHQ